MLELPPRLIPRRRLLLALTAFAPLLFACSLLPESDNLKGTPFTGKQQAHDFELTDQYGKARSLRRDFAGKVVVLTFLYTQCPDVCPIVTNHLRDISEMLESDSAGAELVIVSVDPVGDTAESARAYSERWGMEGRWTYLVGEEAVLRDVWKAYYIDPYVHGPGRVARPTPEAQSSESQAKAGVSGLVEQTGRVIHSAPVYIIDAEGVMRSAFTLPLESEDVVHDIKLVGD